MEIAFYKALDCSIINAIKLLQYIEGRKEDRRKDVVWSPILIEIKNFFYYAYKP